MNNAVEKKSLLQEQNLQQQQKISKLKGMQYGLAQQQREQQYQLDLANLEQRNRQLEYELELEKKKLQFVK